MLLQRKTLAFVAPSSEKYLIFMLLKVRKWTAISPAKYYQNSLKRVLLQRKLSALVPFNLAHPVHCNAVTLIGLLTDDGDDDGDDDDDDDDDDTENNLHTEPSCTFWPATCRQGNRRRRTAGDSRCDDVVVFLRHISHYILTTHSTYSILRPLHTEHLSSTAVAATHTAMMIISK